MSDDNSKLTSSTTQNPMNETKPPVMPTMERRDGGDKETKRG